MFPSIRTTSPTRASRSARSALATVLFAATMAFVAKDVSAIEEPGVPIGLQAELIAKVAAYDKNFPTRAGDRAHVLIVTKSGDPDSTRAATHMQSALGALNQVGGLPHDEATVPFTSAAALAQVCRDRRIAIVYLTAGFGADIDAIRAALDGVSVLSIAAIADYVPKGVVLGFDLVSGKPKLLVQLAQAKRQDVAFKAEVLKLMKVYE
ncbi:MAG: YfiR family protein [Polyangiaceae bacterium]